MRCSVTRPPRIVYDLYAYGREPDPLQKPPTFAATLSRETHVSDPLPPQGLRIQVGLAYSDGFGRVIQQKIQAEPGPRTPTTPIHQQLQKDGSAAVGPCSTTRANRSVSSSPSSTIPMLSCLGVRRESAPSSSMIQPVAWLPPLTQITAIRRWSSTPGSRPPGMPTTWSICARLHDLDVRGFVRPYIHAEVERTGESWQTWKELRETGVVSDPKRKALERTLPHADTPAVAYLDSLGRPFLTIADNGKDENDVQQLYHTRVKLDLEGNQRAITDALERVVMEYDYDMLGNQVHQASMEAGERWSLNGVAGQPIRAWDSRGHLYRTEYDILRRPLARYMEGTDSEHSDPRTLGANPVRMHRVWGGPAQRFGLEPADTFFPPVRWRRHRHQPGLRLQGNALRSSRQLVDDYAGIPDWDQDPTLQSELFSQSTIYDALNRPIQ